MSEPQASPPSNRQSVPMLRIKETDSAGNPTGHVATFAGVEFQGLQYDDLINHTLGTRVKVPLRWTNARVVESNFDGINVGEFASVNTTLESPYSSRTIGLVRDGWLPSGLAFQDDMVVMPDKCTVCDLLGRFRDGAKTRAADKDFLDLIADRPIRINPLLYALEGNVRENPSPEVIEQQLEEACTKIAAALPLAELFPPGRSGLQGAVGIARDTQAGLQFQPTQHSR